MERALDQLDGYIIVNARSFLPPLHMNAKGNLTAGCRLLLEEASPAVVCRRVGCRRGMTTTEVEDVYKYLMEKTDENDIRLETACDDIFNAMNRR